MTAIGDCGCWAFMLAGLIIVLCLLPAIFHLIDEESVE